MRAFVILLSLSLIIYSYSAVTGVALELKASQTVNTGSNVKFKITVTVSGDDDTATNDKVTIKTIEGLLLVKSDDDTKNSEVTCSISETEVVRNTPKDFECTAKSLSTAGNYKLAKNDQDFKLTDSDDAEIDDTSVTGTVTMEVKTTDSSTSSDTTSSSKF